MTSQRTSNQEYNRQSSHEVAHAFLTSCSQQLETYFTDCNSRLCDLRVQQFKADEKFKQVAAKGRRCEATIMGIKLRIADMERALQDEERSIELAELREEEAGKLLFQTGSIATLSSMLDFLLKLGR